MRESKSRLAALAAVAMLGSLGGYGPSVQQAQGQSLKAEAQANQTQKGERLARAGFGVEAAMRMAFGGGYNQRSAGGYKNLAGWTNARYQRHARKLRNRAKHRRACRG